MPTILRIGPYRFFFYAGDRNEPQHIHVERDENLAKFWLRPTRLQSSGGFARREINRIHEGKPGGFVNDGYDYGSWH